MQSFTNKPAFGGRLRTDEFYIQVDAAIRQLRPLATLRDIAQKLNTLDFRTPRGHIWDRQKVATYLRRRSI